MFIEIVFISTRIILETMNNNIINLKLNANINKKAIMLYCLIIFMQMNFITTILGIDINYKNKISLNLGNPSTCFEIGIDLTQQTWLVKNTNDDYKSTSAIIISNAITLHNQEYNFTGTEIRDEVRLFENKNDLIQLQFYILYKPSLFYSVITQSISLPSHYINEDKSIIHKLKQKGFIKYLAFSFISFDNKRQLIMGGIPKDITKTKYHSFINIIGRNFHWDSLLSHIIMKNNSHILKYETKQGINDYVDFNMIDEYIFVPKEFMALILKQFYFDLIPRAHCSQMVNRNFLQLTCVKSAFSTIRDIIFFIGEHSYTIDLNKLWYCASAYCYFSIVESPYGNEWRFGSRFLNLFDVLFDYENKMIYFYSDIYKMKHSKSNFLNLATSYYCKLNICLLFIGLFLLIFNPKPKHILQDQ